MIKTLFIDIGEVLVGLNYQEPLRTIHELSGLHQEEIRRRLDGCSEILLYEKGQLSTDEFFNCMVKRLELAIPLEDFKKLWAGLFVFGEEAVRPLLSPELFQQLKEANRLVALSNTNDLHFTYLRGCCPLIEEFHDYVLSYRVGSVKPEAEIYQAALAKAQCSPSETLFVDDRPENIQAAERLGIKGIVFRGEDELRKELINMRILGNSKP